jgi:HK97 family phage prohead protease
MPWHIVADHSGCGKGKFAVVKDADGSVVACHTTRKEASKHMAALYANTPDARSGELLTPRPVSRTYQLEDMTIRSDGSGRIVESYFAVYGVKSEVMDQDGHYHEVNAPSLFTKTLAERGLNIPVFYNHARTLDGTPAADFSVPIGVPVDIKSDDRGVFNAVRYLDNPLADSILDGIRNRVINGMSYSGRFIKSVKSWPEGRGRGRIPQIVRHEAALREFGPTPMPQFPEAAILGTRAQQVLRMLLAPSQDVRMLLAPGQDLSWLEQFEGLTTPDGEPEDLTSDTPEQPGAVEQTDEPHVKHSARSLASRIRAARITRGME